MVNNQEWFDKKYFEKKEELKSIRVASGGKFQDHLLIENYPKLEKLFLKDFESIDQITLKNLPQLQEVTIWDCGLKGLMIENCPKVKELNVRNNLLDNLELLRNLNKLEKLEIDNNKEIKSGLEYLSTSLKSFSCENTKLAEILKPYKGDWKFFRKAQEIIKLTKQSPEKLVKVIWDLQEENKKLRQNQPIAIDNPTELEQKYQKLKGILNFLIKEEQLKTEEINLLKTEELTNSLVGKLKNQEENLSNLQKTNQELQEKLVVYETVKDKIQQKEQELAKLKNTITTKYQLEEDELDDVLEAQINFFKNNDSTALNRNKKKLARIISEEEITNLCQKQEKIIKLQVNINQREQQINQIIIKGNIVQSFVGNFEGDIHHVDMSRNNALEEENINDNAIQANVEINKFHENN